MLRRPYSESPMAWNVAARTAESRIDYACPIQRQRDAKSDRTLLVLFVIALLALLMGVM